MAMVKTQMTRLLRLLRMAVALLVLNTIVSKQANAQGSFGEFRPTWQENDWWIVEENGWSIIGFQAAPPDPRWHHWTSNRWLCIVASTNATNAVLEIHQPAEIDAHGKLVWSSAGARFHPEPSQRIAIELKSLLIVAAEQIDRRSRYSFCQPYSSLGCLPLILPSFTQDHERKTEIPGWGGSKQVQLVENHRVQVKGGMPVDSVLFVLQEDRGLLDRRKAWGLDWSQKQNPARFEERQEWRKGDKWYSRMVRYTEISQINESQQRSHDSEREFWTEFKKTGWPEDKPNVEARLIEQSNRSQKEPPFSKPDSK